MASLTRFEQEPGAPEGVGVFHFDSGETHYGYEPELAAQVSKVKGALDAAPDMRVAGPGGGWLDQPPDPGVFQASDTQAFRNQFAAPQAHSAPAAPPSNVAAMAARPFPAAPPPAPAPQGGPTAMASDMGPPPAGGPDLATQAREAMGQRAAEALIRGTKRVQVAGSPGVDPHRMIREGVDVPTTGSTVQESGAPYDPRQAVLRIGAAEDVRAANQAGIELQQQQTENELNRQRTLAPKLAEAAAVAETNHARMVGAYRQERARLQQDLDQYDRTAHINPDRYFEDRGVFATIGMAIGQAMGAYASTVSGAPNFAFEMVQKAIDRDIAAQKDQLEAGRASRRNRLAQFMNDYGYDLEQSEAALRIAMNKSARKQAEMYANEAKLPQYQVEAQKMNALTNQKIIESEQALQNASIGKFTRSQQTAFTQPKAATAGGTVEKPLTPEEHASLAKNLPKDQQATFGELTPEKQADLTKEYGLKRQATANVRTAADDLAATYRGKDGKPLRIDWKRGVLVDGDGKPVTEDDVDVPGDSVVGVDSDSVLDRNSVKATRDARNRFANAAAFEVFGAATPEQIESLKPSLFGTDERGAFRGLMNSIKKTTENERLLETAYPSEVQRANQSRDVQTMRDRKRAPDAVKVSKY